MQARYLKSETRAESNWQLKLSCKWGLSDCRGLVATNMSVKYCNYKNFDNELFREEVNSLGFGCDADDLDLLYENITANARSIVNKHAPVKTKILRGNEAPFMNK